MSVLRLLSLAIVLAVFGTGPSLAADASKFYGKFAGEALTVFDANDQKAGQKRKSEVEIKAAPEGGFEVSWTTSIPDVDNVEPRLRTTTMVFAPSGNPAVWHALRTGNPLLGQATIWSRIADNTLTIYIVGMLKNGVMVTATYRRKLEGDTMTIEFESTHDGARHRAVQGTLTRVKG